MKAGANTLNIKRCAGKLVEVLVDPNTTQKIPNRPTLIVLGKLRQILHDPISQTRFPGTLMNGTLTSFNTTV